MGIHAFFCCFNCASINARSLSNSAFNSFSVGRYSLYLDENNCLFSFSIEYFITDSFYSERNVALLMSKGNKKRKDVDLNIPSARVDDTGIEPVTPTMSR